MTHEHDLGALARSIIDSNRYMTLGTADESGQPRLSPVWDAPAEYREFFWVSKPRVQADYEGGARLHETTGGHGRRHPTATLQDEPSRT